MPECQSLFPLYMLWLKSLGMKMGGRSGDRKEVAQWAGPRGAVRA